MIINFYPLTDSEITIFNGIQQLSLLIVTQHGEHIGVDADALQLPELVNYFNVITFDSNKIIVLDTDLIETLNEAKGTKERDINNWYQNILSKGHNIGDGFILSFNDINKYISLVSLIEFSVGKSNKKETDTHQITDKDGISRAFKLKGLITILERYINTYDSISNLNILLIEKLRNAKTVEKLSNIKTDFIIDDNFVESDVKLLLANLIQG